MAQQEKNKPHILLITRNTQMQLDSVLDDELEHVRERCNKKFIKTWISPSLKRKDFSIKHTRYGRPVNLLAVTQDEYDYLTDSDNHTLLHMICGAPIENLARMDRAEFYAKWNTFREDEKSNLGDKFHRDIWMQKGREVMDELIELI